MRITICKFITSFMLIFISIVFCGCGTINYVNYKDEDGNFHEVIEYYLDEEKFANYPSISKVKNEITTIANKTLIEKYQNYETLVNNLVISCQTNPDKQHLVDSYKELLTHVSFDTPHWEGNYFKCRLAFTSTSAYLIYYELTNTNFSLTKTKEGFLYNTTYFIGNPAYLTEKSLYANIKFNLSKTFTEFSAKDLSFSYTYLTTSKRYHSNANYVEYAGENYYAHVWNLNEGNINKEIYFYLKLANRSSWYIIAIIISILTTAIMLLVGLVIHKITKNKTKKTYENS